MMTRAEARKAECPFQVEKEDIQWENWGATGRGKGHIIFHRPRCRAEGCPVWQDEQREGFYNCTGEAAFINKRHRAVDDEARADCRAEHGLDDCATCPDVYGCCGGRA